MKGILQAMQHISCNCREIDDTDVIKVFFHEICLIGDVFLRKKADFRRIPSLAWSLL